VRARKPVVKKIPSTLVDINKVDEAEGEELNARAGEKKCKKKKSTRKTLDVVRMILYEQLAGKEKREMGYFATLLSRLERLH